MDKCGIYRIVNTRNKKCYVGSTINLSRRKFEHFSNLRHNNHHSPYLQNAYNAEIDKSVFIYEIKLICSEDMLIFYEQTFMDLYSPEYNMVCVAGRSFLTEEIIRKRANSLKKTLALPHQKERLRLKMLGDKNPARNSFVKEKISKSISTYMRSLGDDHHMKRPEHRQRMKIDNPGRRLEHIQRMRTNNPAARKIIEVSSGKVFNTVTEAANIYNIDISGIVKVCKGKRKSVNGHKFSYAEIAL